MRMLVEIFGRDFDDNSSMNSRNRISRSTPSGNNENEMKYLYLDTSRLRTLAESYEREIWAPVDSILKNRQAVLIISLAHLYDFSTREAGVEDTTATYLDSLDTIKWVSFPYDVFQEELRVATEFLLRGETSTIMLFFDKFNDVLRYYQYKVIKKRGIIPNVLTHFGSLYDIYQPRTISEFIDYCAKHKIFDVFKKQLHADADRLTQLNKKDAAIWKNPIKVLRSHIEAYVPQKTKAGELVPNDIDFIDKLLDIAERFMPSLSFTTALARVKFGYENMIVEANDLIDEFHASYTPYCDGVMLDRGSCGRVQQTNYNYKDKVVSNPEELLYLLRK